MNGFRAVYHFARADYFERTRRSSFLIILGLTVVAGYFYLPANSSSTKTLTFTISFAGSVGRYRGVYNSAWVGTQVALFATLWLSIIGFYLVKNTLDRDVRTGVGQIIATTPLRKAHYTLGKALSNFAVLGTMVVILALAAGGMQLLRAEDTHIDLWALLSPFVFIMLPAMAVVAALAILFEAVAWLRGTLGNVVYFFLISAVIPITATVNTGPAGDLLGSNFLIQQMQMAVKAAVPGYNENFDYGTRFGTTLFHTFYWGGMLWVGIAIVLALSTALFFSRFDPAYERQKHATRMVTPEFLLAPEQELPVPPPDQMHLNSLPIWSVLGSRETRHHTEQLVFSTAHPLMRQLPMQWLAGVVVALLTASGMIAHFVLMGDWPGLLALGVGAIFVPALALAAGVWTGNSRLFEVTFVVLWYVGCINHLSALDFMGAAGTSVAMRIPFVYGMVAAVLLLLAFVGRKRQLQV